MENQKQTSFTFEIDNFSEKKAEISSSPDFLSGGCAWLVEVHPKGYIVDDHLSLYLFVANPESLRLGWKRRATFSLILLNQSGKELCRKHASGKLFCAEFPGYGWEKAVPLKNLQEKGFLEKNKLIVKVEVKVVEVVDEGDVTGKETLDFEGFQILYSQVVSVSWIFDEHPDFAVNVRQKNQRVKTTYMNILLDLIETLRKPSHSITETELRNAQSELMDLTEAGFKLDWLKTKLDGVSLERKKQTVLDLKAELNKEKRKSAAKVMSLDQTVSGLKDELNKEKGKSDASAARVLSLEQTVADLKYELNKEKRESAAKVLSLEHTVSNLEEEVSDLKDVLNKEEGKSDTCAAKVLSLEQTVSDLNDEVSDLKDELNKEKGNSNTCAAEVLSLKQTVSDLKDELNKEKHESDSSAAKVLSLEQTVSDLEDELNKNEAKSATCAAKVLSLEQTVLNLKDVLNREKGKSDTFSAKVLLLEQTVLNLTAELKEEKGVVSSWEVLDCDDLHNEE